MIGYQTKDLILQKSSSNDALNLTLPQASIALEEVVVRSKNLKSHTKGRKKFKTKRAVNFSISSKNNQNLGAEIGRRFKLSSRKQHLLRKASFYIKYNDFESAKFRINIYSIKNKLPDQLLNTQNIIIDVAANKTGWIDVDLSSYDIAVQQDIIVAVEWIAHSPKGKYLSLPIIVPSFGSVHYYKFGSQSKWKKFSTLSTAMRLTYSN